MARGKLFAVLAALALAVAIVSGCAGDRSSSQGGAGQLEPIVVGADVYPPFSSNDENGEPTGIDVDIAREAFHRIGYEPSFEYIQWDNKAAILHSGQIDCIMSCFSINGRENDYRWAGPYLKSRQVVAVDPGSPIQSLSDLAGKTVAVQSSTKPESIILDRTNEDVPEIGSLFSFSDRSFLIPALSKGYVDAVAAHETSIMQYEKDYGVQVRILDESLLDVGLGCAFDLDDDRGIDEKLDQAFRDMLADGTMEDILSRYVDDPSPFLNVGSLDE